MSESLARRYRPDNFSKMIGQRLNSIVLQKMVDSDRVPSAMLFIGPSGTGKTTAARILAASLNPEKSDQDMFTIEVDAASNGGVSDIRSLLDSIRYETGGAKRVIILDEAHSLTREAFNVLLKPTEEPPEGTYFVLVTTHPEKIPPTIKTRMTEFEFRSVPTSEILDLLVEISAKEEFSVSSELLSFLADTSNGSARMAITALDQVTMAGISTVDEYVALAGLTDPAPALFRAMLTGGHDKVFGELDSQLKASGNAAHVASKLTEFIRDIFILKAGGRPSANGKALFEREDLASRIEQDRLFQSARIVWDLKTRIRPSDDPRGSLELALMLITDVLNRGREVAQSPKVKNPESTHAENTTDTPRKLTLAEIKQRISA